uniref:Intraflagellar transport 20 n=1 Tax=Ovis aries TaxID=9940 RepID=A0AC11CK77_SHEEP
MAKDILAEAGLHFDELNKLRVLDPEVTQQTIELKEECKDFVDSECRLGGHGATQLCALPPSRLQLWALSKWSCCLPGG